MFDGTAVQPATGRAVGSVATAERLLRAATVRTEVVDPGSAAAQSALEHYFAELNDRFRSGFDPAAGGAADIDAMRVPRGVFLTIGSDQAIVGCGGLQRIDENTAEIKRMWIHVDWRGLGLGSRLLGQIEAIARQLGLTRVVLDTNETLVEAIAMYERAGYHATERYSDNPYAHHWFAKDL